MVFEASQLFARLKQRERLVGNVVILWLRAWVGLGRRFRRYRRRSGRSCGFDLVFRLGAHWLQRCVSWCRTFWART